MKIHCCAECHAPLSPEHQAEINKLCDEDQRRAPKQCEACWRKADKGDDTYEFPEHTEF